jgi:hypothetical protein
MWDEARKRIHQMVVFACDDTTHTGSDIREVGKEK